MATATTTITEARVVRFSGKDEDWPAFSKRLNAAISKSKLRKIAAGTETRPPDSTGDATAIAARAKEQEAWDDQNDALHTLIVDRLDDTVLVRVASAVPDGDGKLSFVRRARRKVQQL